MESEAAYVYEKYAVELIRLATTLVGPSAAEDLVSTVFCRVLAAAAWSGIENKRAYLYRCLVNEARSRHRSTQRRLRREIAMAGRESVEQHSVSPDVLRAMRTLTVRQRAAIWMAYWLDAPAGEIGRALGVSERTVERELQQARRRLERDLT